MIRRLDQLNGGAGVEAGRPAGPAPLRPGEKPGEFAALLDARLQPAAPPASPVLPQVAYTTHAQGRMERYQIRLDVNQTERLAQAVDGAAKKGARQALVLLDDKAFVVGVRERTVITAIDRSHMRENIFTNIDATVLA